MGAGTQGLEPSFVSIPGHQKLAGSEVEQLGHELARTWEAGAAGKGLTCYVTMLPLAFFGHLQVLPSAL